LPHTIIIELSLLLLVLLLLLLLLLPERRSWKGVCGI
jgi:hypothetical protein